MPQTRRRLSLIALLAATLAFGCNSDTRSGESDPDGWTNHPDTGQPAPDGGDTGLPGSEPDAETGTRGCTQQQESLLEFVEPSGPRFRMPGVAWEVVEGPAIGQGAEPIEASWKGIERLDFGLSFDCPPSQADPGLECVTGHALTLERDINGETQTIRVALALPHDSIAWPSEGTDVVIARHPTRFLTMREASEETPFVGLGRSRDPGLGTTRFDRSYGQLSFNLDAAIGEPTTAICSSTDECNYTTRLERLTVEGEESVELGLGATDSLAVGGSTHRVWHVGSVRRNLSGSADDCDADVIPPQASYGFARVQ